MGGCIFFIESCLGVELPRGGESWRTFNYPPRFVNLFHENLHLIKWFRVLPFHYVFCEGGTYHWYQSMETRSTAIEKKSKSKTDPHITSRYPPRSIILLTKN